MKYYNEMNLPPGGVVDYIACCHSPLSGRKCKFDIATASIDEKSCIVCISFQCYVLSIMFRWIIGKWTQQLGPYSVLHMALFFVLILQNHNVKDTSSIIAFFFLAFQILILYNLIYRWKYLFLVAIVNQLTMHPGQVMDYNFL